jgi:hypothetical protein
MTVVGIGPGPRILLTLLLARHPREIPANMFAVASSSAVRAPARASASKPSRGAKPASALRDDAKAVVATSAIVAPAAFPAAALAVDKDAIESFVSAVESDKDVVLSLFSKVADAASAAKDALAPVADQLAPVAREVTKEGAVVAREVTTKAAPVVKSIGAEAGKNVDVAIKAAQGAVKSTGIDTAPIESVSKSAAGVAKSAASAAEPALVGALNSVNDYITHLPSAVTTGASALAALAVVTSPLWWDAFVRSARGYAGDVTAVQAYDDAVSGSAYIVDLRSVKAQERGVPKVRGGRVLLVPPVTVDDGALRGRLADAAALEIRSTAVVVAALKKIGKSSRVILMGPSAKAVAGALTAMGFGEVYVMEGEFDKKRGWVESGLATEAGPEAAAEAKSLAFF